MKALIQRGTEGRVRVEGQVVGEIGRGIVRLLGGDEEVAVGEGWFFPDKTGWYEVAVPSEAGSSCAEPYTLTIEPDTR